MSAHSLRATLGVAILALFVAACGTQPSTTPAPTATPDGAMARASYSVAICPIFEEVALLDPRLADLRALGAREGDVPGHSDQLDEIVDELGVVLTDLEAVPSWGPGDQLRYQLTTSLHEIRTHLLLIAQEPAAADAAASLAATPFVASDDMDRAMQLAVEAGLVCLPTG